MRCPFCHHHDTVVKDSRTANDYTSIRRRRSCTECGSRFTTLERVQLRDINVIKKDGTTEPFDRDKLARSVTSAMHKHSLDMDKIERLVNSIVRKIEITGESDISSQTIGERVMRSLAELDPVAYIRFASIYREFVSAQDFVDCLSRLDENESTEELNQLKVAS